MTINAANTTDTTVTMPSSHPPQFSIPASSTLLVPVPATSTTDLSDSAITTLLTNPQPITSEKNVWAFWDSGLSAMPPSHQKTVHNWVRKLGPSWTVRVLDLVPGSPNHLSLYMDMVAWLPACVVDGTMSAQHRGQHTSDLLRLPLLYLHGGVWMDVGNMLHTHLDDLFWSHISSPDTPHEMAVWIITGQIRRAWGSFGNFMLAARRRCEFVLRWHEGYKALWVGRTSARDFHEHPLVREVGLADGLEDIFGADEVRSMSDYVAQMLIGDRTRHLLDVRDGWNGRDFFENKVFKVEGLPNGILGAILTDLSGERQVELFTTRLDDPDEVRRKAAEEFVVAVLEKSDMYKVYHNPSAVWRPALGDLIKKDEFKDATYRPGTYGELYRYGTVHWKSTKEIEQSVPFGEKGELIHATPTTAQGEKPGGIEV